MKLKIGDIYPTRFGNLEVTSYKNCDKVSFKFKDSGYEGVTSAGNIRKGLVKDRLAPTRYGIGILGVGDYKPCIDREQTPAYLAWNNMMARCYSGLPKYQTYADVSVCTAWCNFQVFAKWFEDNFVEGYHLDKDIRTAREVRIYSPETCMFVEAVENIREATVKPYILTSPEGVLYSGWNVEVLCRRFNLDSGTMSKLLNGKRNSCKGWTCQLIEG